MADHNDTAVSDSAKARRPEELLVVGIGASAGGIAALRQFFGQVEPASGVAYIVILHLSPDHDSRLSEVLQAATALPVSQVRERVMLAADHVYVIAPNVSLSIADGYLVPEPIASAADRRAPVDRFFRALAEAYGPNAVSVVLSGTGPNGSNGLKRVKERGGLAIAQEPREAEYGDMPTNSIATGLIDFVLPVKQIPAKILEYHRRLRDVTRATPEIEPAAGDAEAFREIVNCVRVRTSHDFSNYKVSTILRRIQRRISVLGLGSLPDYAAFLRTRPEEPALLMKELLISVTNFFRDHEAFHVLQRRVIPQLFQGKRQLDQVRVWVTGCATGEEAYSIAMLLSEYAEQITAPPRIQVFASDLDTRAIAVARDGFYTDAEVADVSLERLQRYFFREAGGYRVRRELRELLLFALHNAIKDPPFSHIDLLTCRNLLIYLNRSIQERLVETFHFALRPGGYLFLGTSESPDGSGELFFPVDKDAHIYESRLVTSRLTLPFAEPEAVHTTVQHQPPAPVVPERLFPIDLHHRLLEEYGPPSLIVTDDHVLVHVSQKGGQYLQVGRGEPSRDVLQLIHRDLRLDLRTALYQAAQQRAQVQVRGVRLQLHDTDKTLNILVRPVLREGDVARGFFLILFEDDTTVSHDTAGTLQLQSPSGHQSADLEEELVRLKSQLSVTIEQYETQAEEGKAANEELQAANEELRSSTEELETSKEELQSVNEELTTVNQELKIKVEELRLTNNDFQNFINATSVPTIFLDRSLRVKLSTSRAHDIFNLLPSDVGRRLSDITTKLTYGGLLDDATQVLEQLQSVEREAHTKDGAVLLVRIFPYRTTDDRIEGVVLTFLDVTALRRAQAEVAASEQRLRLLIDTAVDYGIFTMSDNGTIDSWNGGAERVWGYAPDEIVGKTFEELFTPDDRAAGIPARELATARRDGRALDERIHQRADGTTFYASGVTTGMGDDTHFGFVKIARDLTESRRSQEALAHAHAELEQRVASRTSLLEQQQAQIRGLLRQVVTTQEEQRGRIARDLHDQLGQQVTALRLTIEHGQQKRSRGDHPDEELERALTITHSISGEIDFLAWELRPAVLDHLGLAAALPRFVQEWSQHYRIQGECRLSGFRAGDLSKDGETTFYRIAQEALNNVLKHAHAHRVDVVLETRDAQVRLLVADDGVGFESAGSPAAVGGFGVFSMRERAALIGATVEIESTVGQGTTVYLRSAADAAPREPGP